MYAYLRQCRDVPKAFLSGRCQAVGTRADVSLEPVTAEVMILDEFCSLCVQKNQ